MKQTAALLKSDRNEQLDKADPSGGKSLRWHDRPQWGNFGAKAASASGCTTAFHEGGALTGFAKGFTSGNLQTRPIFPHSVRMSSMHCCTAVTNSRAIGAMDVYPESLGKNLAPSHKSTYLWPCFPFRLFHLSSPTQYGSAHSSCCMLSDRRQLSYVSAPNHPEQNMVVLSTTVTQRLECGPSLFS